MLHRYLIPLALALLSLASIACRSDEKRYEVRGQVVGIRSSEKEVTLKHDAIPGFMDAMTMPFKVQDVRELSERRPGDLVRATLVVRGPVAYLRDLEKTGFAEIVPPAKAEPASSGFELVKEGEAVPEVTLTDHTGRERTLSEFQGKAVALTFIYTRCPLPTFCPMMDRHFAAVQRSVQQSAAMRGRVQLLSVSFDPAYDTPEVLKRHAERLGADTSMWLFLTGDRDAVDRFGARFGVSIMRNPRDAADITHNLRTAVIDPAGKLVKVYSGFDWTPSQVVSDLQRVVPPASTD
jgi:protein SCO1/2